MFSCHDNIINVYNDESTLFHRKLNIVVHLYFLCSHFSGQKKKKKKEIYEQDYKYYSKRKSAYIN